MEYSTILYKADDRVAWITLNRPTKRNAFSIKLCNEFQDALVIAERDPDVRVIVVKGEGGRAFSTGFDMDEDKTEFGPANIDDWTINDLNRSFDHGVKFLHSVFHCSKPVIAMIDGYCLAGALDLATLCDIRYCSDDSRFGLIEARMGIGDTELPMMSHLIGQRCRELIYTGDMFDAQEAYRLGLVNRVFPKDRLEEEVTRIAKRMSRVALPTLVWNKKVLNNTLHAAGLDSALRYGFAADLIISRSDSEFKHFRELARTEGAKAAFQWRDSIFAPFESETSWVSSRTAPKRPGKG
ncbi:enoyl-CoA hydratase/carnithine racemase [Bradyrhizobium sp. USDA 4532]|uniref:enoyl-CoA hydratase/isomerase family protein n=1 Tax=unclassified Bradyrhizobium TaxID=2631580 RepID=UPI00209D1F9D|nr:MULTISPECIES: enoyl-CoA hydratase/isomerase family protein [unclassified Bradyrhizobium]MCP1835553.1 enoyl-CoA hydratase/carnithine racemase [Bradyrhizobium sp. USDA 4545]MCP1835633.1 enoyl-CoA hydratase/carnithine racemase [Bradyrhizobium sp. USDA 4545]MCP1920300.1 enoyl-CoA hydratase/carnithine racemase [Bradyrhizobium sp. USDA 4532]MCP1920382.1 enoyl-CoA hydratase/carnithine racemase [Bradyrhizobium sp. USDA 4532]